MLDRRGTHRYARATVVLALSVLGGARAASADPATAEALFREGRRLLDEGRYAEACAILAESQAQDPASGTLINLALCFEKQGKLATAWAQYRAAATLARKDGRTDRVVTAEQKITELEGRVPRLVVHAPKPLPGMEARWNDVRIGAGAFDTPIPLDPGTVAVTVSAPGYLDFTATVSVAENESKTLHVPELRRTPVPAAAPAQSPAPQATATAPVQAPPPVDDRSGEGTPRWPGYVVGGAGIAAIGVGAYFGVSSLNAYAEAEGACPTHQDCGTDVRETRNEAETKAWISNLTIGAGLLAVGVGAWLVFQASDDERTTVHVRVTPIARGAALTLGTSL